MIFPPYALYYVHGLFDSVLLLQVLMESYNRFIEFVRRSNAVSPTVALETAAALQVTMSNSYIDAWPH